jgi:hypothetical protein
MKIGIAMMLTALLSAALFAIPSKVAIAQTSPQNQTMPANATKSTSVLIPINLGQLRDQIRSQHPLLAAIADKIQTMDAKDTLKYTIGVDIVSDMLKAHARQLLLLGKAISNQTSGNQTSGNQTK